MKIKLVLVAFLLVVMFSLTSVSFADNYKRLSEDDHALRIVAYVFHPIGMAAEYAITRPVHWITKQVTLNKIFGSKNEYDDVSFVFE